MSGHISGDALRAVGAHADIFASSVGYKGAQEDGLRAAENGIAGHEVQAHFDGVRSHIEDMGDHACSKALKNLKKAYLRIEVPTHIAGKELSPKEQLHTALSHVEEKFFNAVDSHRAGEMKDAMVDKLLGAANLEVAEGSKGEFYLYEKWGNTRDTLVGLSESLDGMDEAACGEILAKAGIEVSSGGAKEGLKELLANELIPHCNDRQIENDVAL